MRYRPRGQTSVTGSFVFDIDHGWVDLRFPLSFQRLRVRIPVPGLCSRTKIPGVVGRTVIIPVLEKEYAYCTERKQMFGFLQPALRRNNQQPLGNKRLSNGLCHPYQTVKEESL